MADQSDESFLQAWEAHEKCPSPVRVEDPWGSIAPQGEPGPGNPNKGLPTTTAAIDEKPSSDIHYVNSVFQSSNHNNSCAIISTSTTTNKNNNSNTGTPNEATRGFKDDFGAWSETDVIFKSGLLDEEFKTVSVTAEEDDLWSSADLSSLSLSAIAEDVGPGGLGDRANSKETFQGHDIITPPEAGKNSHGYGPSDLASMKENRDVTPSHGSSNKSGSCSGNNALVRPMPGRDGLSGSFIDNDRQGVAAKSVPHDENNSTPSDITRHSRTITAAVASEGSISDQIGYGSAGAAVRQTENTSINLTPGIVISNREAALSADVHGGTPLNSTYSSNTSSTEEDSVVLNRVAPSGARENIPSVTANRGTFRGGTKQSIMGNVLDSDKEDTEAMEGGDAVAQDKSEQTASSGAVNGESLAVDMKETVVLNEDGSELVVNGGSTEGGPDDSLDTETQTKEDEFPPDDLIGGEMAQPKQNGTMESKDKTRPDEVQEVVNGRDLPSENPLGVEENGLEESSRGGEEESPEGVEAQSEPINEETGLRSINSGDSYVKSAVKLREKKGSKVNSHVVKQSRVSFVEQELIRQKQQEEEFRREREQRTQDIQHHGKAPVPPPAARVKSPISPQPPAAKAAPAKPTKPANSKAKAIYQELNYNPKTGGNRSTAMAKDWENKFEK